MTELSLHDPAAVRHFQALQELFTGPPTRRDYCAAGLKAARGLVTYFGKKSADGVLAPRDFPAPAGWTPILAWLDAGRAFPPGTLVRDASGREWTVVVHHKHLIRLRCGGSVQVRDVDEFRSWVLPWFVKPPEEEPDGQPPA